MNNKDMEYAQQIIEKGRYVLNGNPAFLLPGLSVYGKIDEFLDGEKIEDEAIKEYCRAQLEKEFPGAKRMEPEIPKQKPQEEEIIYPGPTGPEALQMAKFLYETYIFVCIPLIGKRPILGKWEQRTTLPEDQIWLNQPNCNIGIVCGQASGIVVLDIDIKDQGLEQWEEYIKLNGEPKTFKVKTGSGGYHYYFKYNADVTSLSKMTRCATKSDGTKIGWDFLTNKSQVVAPGSIHPITGIGYRAEHMAINDMPKWILDMIRPKPKTIPRTPALPLPSPNRPALPKPSPRLAGLPRSLPRLHKIEPPVIQPEIPTPNPTTDTPVYTYKEFTIEALKELLSLIPIETCTTEMWRLILSAMKEQKHIEDNQRLRLMHVFSSRSEQYYDPRGLNEKWEKNKGGINGGYLLNRLKDAISPDAYVEFKNKHGLISGKKRKQFAENDRIYGLYYKAFESLVQEDIVKAMIKEHFAFDDTKQYYRLIINFDTQTEEFLWDEEKKMYAPISRSMQNTDLKARTCSKSRKTVKSFVEKYAKDKKREAEANEYDEDVVKAITKKAKSDVKKVAKGLGDQPTRKKHWEMVRDICSISFSEKENDEWVPMNNGCNINMFTGEIRERTYKDICMLTINACLDPNITSIIPPANSTNQAHKDVYDFFYKICCRDIEYVVCFIKLLGVFISGRVDKTQTFASIVGEGNNGKSILLAILKVLLGEFQQSTATSVVYDTGKTPSPNQATPDLIKLCGARLITVEEGSKGRGYNIEMKIYTSGGYQNMRANYGDSVERKITGHFLLAVNPCDLPNAKVNCDSAFVKRIKVFPMNACFITENMDNVVLKHLPNELDRHPADYNILNKMTDKAHLDAFFTMMWLGSQEYYKDNYKMKYPKVVMDATNEYLNGTGSGSCPYDDFVFDRCVEGSVNDTKFRVLRTLLWEKYHEYCKEKGGNNDVKENFHKTMDKFYPKVKYSTYYNSGLRLKTDEEVLEHEAECKAIKLKELAKLVKPVPATQIEREIARYYQIIKEAQQHVSALLEQQISALTETSTVV